MNRMITKVLCILLALVLMSSSAVSYTFAEFATNSSVTDTARSTTWGVNVSVTGNAFATKYTTSTTYSGIDVSVASLSTADIVAPGTKGTFTGIRVTGTPETSAKITITPNLELTNWTASSAYYCPIKITVNGTTYSGLSYSSSAEFEAAVENAIKAANGTYSPGTNLANVKNLSGDYTWEWDFAASGSQTNAKDTAVAGKGTIKLSVTCQVVQVD